MKSNIEYFYIVYEVIHKEKKWYRPESTELYIRSHGFWIDNDDFHYIESYFEYCDIVRYTCLIPMRDISDYFEYLKTNRKFQLNNLLRYLCKVNEEYSNFKYCITPADYDNLDILLNRLCLTRKILV